MCGSVIFELLIAHLHFVWEAVWVQGQAKAVGLGWAVPEPVAHLGVEQIPHPITICIETSCPLFSE